MTENKFEALINGQKIPRGPLDELTETCYEKAKHYRKFEGAESALEWEEMEELLRRIREILREGIATIPLKKYRMKTAIILALALAATPPRQSQRHRLTARMYSARMGNSTS